MADKELEALVERHLPPGSSLLDELAVIRRLSADRREVLAKRLRTLNAFSRIALPSSQDMATAMAELGCSRRQLFRLLDQLREFGPARGLAPYAARNARSTGRRGGLDEPIDEVLVSALRQDPQQRLAQLYKAAVERATQLNMDAPTQYAVRQRVLELRANAKFTVAGRFGAQLAIDQAALDLPFSDDSVEAWLPSATLLIDLNTKLIAGAALDMNFGRGVALQFAIADFRRRASTVFSKSTLRISDRIEKLTWIVPPAVEDFAPLLDQPRKGTKDPEVTIVSKGPRRHGTEIMKALGDRLGPYRFFARRSLSEIGESVDAPRTSWEEAERLFDLCVDRFNANRLAELDRDAPPPIAGTRRKLDKLVGSLCDMFAPVLQAVSDANVERAIAKNLN